MKIKFKNCPWLNVEVDDTPLAKKWEDLVKINYERNPNVSFRDPPAYNLTKLKELVEEANRRLGWNWQTNDLSLQATTTMHKDIEKILADGFRNIPFNAVDFLLNNGSHPNSYLLKKADLSTPKQIKGLPIGMQDYVKGKFKNSLDPALDKNAELIKLIDSPFEDYDQLLYDIHFCLHSVESGSKRDHWLQLEWFNDDGFEIDEYEYPAKIALEPGDIRLQNPYVGHHPLYLYQQNDTSNILQTCKFHNLARPGINIVIDELDNQINYRPEKFWPNYTKWWHENGQDFIATHGWGRIKRFTGHPVVGRITNLDDLEYCVAQPVLEFEALSFK